MTDRARDVIDALQWLISYYPKWHLEADPCAVMHSAIGVIETLTAELEQVKQERDGLNIILAQAQSMLETRTRERDAAIAIVAGTPSCETCASYTPGYFCPGCRNKSNWQFCGVKEG